MKVFLVRHAHAGDRDGWRGDDRSRPLTSKGEAQARGLVARLEGEALGQVMSSPYQRCVQTCEPVAREQGLAVHTERLLAEGADWKQTLDLIRDVPQHTLMCSQGDVIGGIISHLASEGMVEPAAARSQKGSTWVLVVQHGDLSGATYWEPLEG